MEDKLEKRIKRRKRFLKIIGIVFISIIGVILSLALLGTVVEAAGLVDETISPTNEYSKYSMDNYQLDFYVDNSWGWLPWNWGSGIGKSVMYGLYAITNFIWTISCYISNATGYLVQEAYSLDFISKTANSIGKNMQTLAGVTKAGFSSSGFYVGFLLILILIVGVYVAYTGLLKRETTKAVKAILNFVVVFVLSASFIAYAPDYITKINDFSKDISQTSLDLGTKIVLPDTNSKGKDSVDMIRDSLFSIQVQQPWLLLQFGTNNVESIGSDRVENLVSTSPDLNDGNDREDIVIEEIEENNNQNLTITKTISRLGTVFFLFFFNIGISIFVFLLTGIMIFSQVLFIIFAMFLPISFLLSMIPSFDGMGRKAVMKLFNVIMTRAGITLIITVAFSISTMLYSLSGSSPFFMVMFLQIVTFAGIYFKLGDLMSMFSLQNNDSQQMGKQILRKPRTFIARQTRRLKRSLSNRDAVSTKKSESNERQINPTTNKKTQASHERSNQTTANKQQSIGEKLGTKVSNVLDKKNQAVHKAGETKENVKNVPTNANYVVHKGRKNIEGNINDFTNTISKTREDNQKNRLKKKNHQRDTIAQKRYEIDKEKHKRSVVKSSQQQTLNSPDITHDRKISRAKK